MKTKNVKVLLSAAIVLLMVWGFVACSKKDSTPPVVKTDLTAGVTAANLLVTTTHEGVAAGNYLKGSQAPLKDAIAQAQAVIDNAAATQLQVTAAAANLAAAVVFKLFIFNFTVMRSYPGPNYGQGFLPVLGL